MKRSCSCRPPAFVDEDGNRRNHDQALNHPLIERRNVKKIEDIVERLHERDAEQRTENAAAASSQRRAAKNHRRDRREVVIGITSRVADAEPADQIDAGEGSEQTRQGRKRTIRRA